jgi:antitoxin MazE
MYLHLEIAMQVARWGNSLAVRIPAKMVKELALKEGDNVEIAVTPLGDAQDMSVDDKRAAAIERLKSLRGGLTSQDLNYNREELYRY